MQSTPHGRWTHSGSDEQKGQCCGVPCRALRQLGHLEGRIPVPCSSRSGPISSWTSSLRLPRSLTPWLSRWLQSAGSWDWSAPRTSPWAPQWSEASPFPPWTKFASRGTSWTTPDPSDPLASLWASMTWISCMFMDSCDHSASVPFQQGFSLEISERHCAISSFMLKPIFTKVK